MAYNKIKHIEAAQKFLSQGKLASAIAEYEAILKVEPNDQVTLMTVGDLNVRAGNTSRALEHFEKLAQSFLADGFVTKAIAIYKKIAKLAPEATTPLEKLAELYVQQGVMNEARSLYLQLAETHLRTARQEKAVEVLRLLLDLEPENLRVQLRLAELYSSIGQKAEAAHAYLNCAHRMFDHSQFAEALRYVEQAIKTDPKNTRASTLKARLLAATGKLEEAIPLLESLPDVAAGGDTTQLLLGFYLQAQRADAAVGLARKAFSGGGRYAVVYDLGVQLLDAGDAEKAFELLSEVRPAMMEAREFDKLSQVLATLAERLSGRLEPIEWLVEVHRQAGDSFRLPEALDQLAEAAAAAGQLDRARQVFEELLQKDPENENVRRKLNQVRARLGLETVAEAPPKPKPVAPEAAVAAAAPVEEEGLDEDTQRFVSQTMTDVDLFSSYGMTQKAIDLLESAVQRVPSHTGMLEKLLDMHLGAGNERRTSELAAQLEKIFTGRGDAARVEHFSELRRRFDRAARLTEEAPAAPAAAPEFSLAPAVPAASQPAPEPAEEAVHEVDLSAEWASLSQITAEPAPAEAPPAPPAEAPAEEVELSLEEVPAAPVVEAAPEAAPAAEAGEEYELELTPAAPTPPAAPPAEAPAAKTTDSFLSELAAEVDGLELGPVTPAAAGEAVPVAARGAKPSEESVEQLKDVFDEFRSELGQMGEEEGEDLETHYNLGIAYREMGLVEEAIGEFQKVAQAVQKGRPFRYAMQCCTLLGLSFMDKGQPSVAVVWYQRALETPNLDQESVLALRYDLGVAQEMAGDPKAALNSFTQVYAMNIDYRDVAERIATLQKQR
jgi:tetratricopeptide (TPR) repeat protein